MTFSYTAPGTSDRDTVRYLLGDTEPDRPLLSDEELDYELATWLPKNGSLAYVAAMAAKSVAARYASEVDVSGDGISVGVASVRAQMEELHQSLMAKYRAEPRPGIGGPDAGGILHGETRHPSVRPTDFGTGMHDNPYAGNQALGDGPAASPLGDDDNFPWTP